VCRSQLQTRCVLLCSPRRGACRGGGGIIIIIIIVIVIIIVVVVVVVAIAVSAAPHMHSVQAPLLVARARAACAELIPFPVWHRVLAEPTPQTVRQAAG